MNFNSFSVLLSFRFLEIDKSLHALSKLPKIQINNTSAPVCQTIISFQM